MQPLRLSFLIFLFIATTSYGATRTWTGAGANSSWTTPANWSPSAATSGDDLVFPPGNLRLSNTNDFAAGTSFSSITFNGTNYSLNGNAIMLAAGIANNAATAGNNTITFPVTVAADQTFSSPNSGSTLIITGNITNNATTLSFSGITVIVTGVISGAGGIQATAGTLLLDAANTYTGPTTVSSGFLIANNSLALGATSSGTTVNSSGTLGFQNNITVPEPITLNSTLVNFSGTNTVTGNITLNIANSTVDVRTNSLLNFTNVLSGAGGLLKTNTGLLRLAGGANNTYAGNTTVNAGTLLLSKTAGAIAIPGALTIGDGIGPAPDTVRLQGPEQIADNAAVTVGSSGLLDAGSFAEKIGSLAGSSGASVVFTNALITGGNGNSTSFASVLSGSGPIQKLGSGVWTLSGTNTYTGNTTLSAGTILVNGQLSGSIVSLSGGTLGGTGVVVAAVSGAGGGVLAPGNSPGRLTATNVTLNAATAFNVELNGSSPGSGYDQLVANGVSLNNAALNVSLNFSPTNGATFVIVTNRGAAAITGTFAGLPEGAQFIGGSAAFSISYVGGTGNDVVLTATGCEAPCNLRVHNPADDHSVYIRWDPPISGVVSEYLIYRDGFVVDHGEPDRYGVLFIYYDPHLLAGHSYTYQVTAVFTNGVVSAPSNPLQINALPLQPKVGTNQIATLLLRFSDYPSEPYAPSFVDDFMFNATNSIKKYMEEVSYGLFSVQGATYGWYTLPHPGSNYCATLFPNGLWYSCNTAQILQDAYTVIPLAVSNALAAANVVQVAIHGMGTVGEAGGGFAFYAATNGFDSGTVVHELGHTLGFLHASSLINCTGYRMGPDLINLRTNNCFTALYGDSYDPMGAGETFHYNSFFKEKAGWLPTNNIQWVTNDGDYVLNAIELPTNAIQTLRIDLGAESFWFLEYRTKTGFDGQIVTNGVQPIDGVLMRLRETQFNFADWETFWIQPVIKTNSPWFDPYNGLSVNVLSQNGRTATVRIAGMSYVFKITDVQRAGPTTNNVQLTWNSVPGARYIIQSSPDLVSWTNLLTSVDATNRLTTFTLTNAASLSRRFFRLGVDTGP